MTDILLLTEREAAQRLRICARALRRARQDGKLHYVLIGRSVRYTVDDLESFIASQRQVQPPCPAPNSKPRSTRRPGTSGNIIPFTARMAGR